MGEEGHSGNRSRAWARSGWVGGLAAALLFVAVWLPLQPPRQHVPTSDLYTHLSVARHLLEGEGFVTDIAYPLSFAFPFARQLPQPLIHRTPGFALWMVPALALAGNDPHDQIAAVRIEQILVLALIVGFGTVALIRRGRAADVGVWWILLLASPLLGFAVDWGFVELPCALLLLLLWLDATSESGPDRLRGAIGPGLGLGALLLLRPELFWVPLLWWAVRRRERRRVYLLAIVVAVLLASPWMVRNARLTGNPFFSLQSQAELVKSTRTWPEYTVYRQLEPQPMAQAWRHESLPILRKFARGIRFQVLNLHRLLPAWYFLGALFWFGRTIWLRRRQGGRRSGPGDDPREPLPLLALTLIGLMTEYSFFDIGLRHLAVLVPVLMLEGSAWTGTALFALLRRRGWRVPAGGSNWRLGAMALVVTLGGVLIFPGTLPGWDEAAADAQAAQPIVELEVQRVLSSNAPYFFTETAAAPYLADRPAVWSPLDDQVRDQIRELLGP